MRTTLKLITIAALLLGLIGCAVDNPVGVPLPSQQAVVQGYQPFGVPAANRLLKPWSGNQMVTVLAGGQLSFQYNDGAFLIKITLSFEPGSVSKDMELNMIADNETVAVTFGPDGTRFLKPGKMYVEARGISLPANLDAQTLISKLKLLYYNEATDSWEPIEAGSYSADVTTGTVICRDGIIRHFSRYGFGM